MALSEKQKEIVNATGKVVVNACPGSGKTYSVAARIAHLLKNKEFNRQGIAAISFTNVAWQEITNKLSKDFKINTPLSFPHFLGTIDSFINQFIFLPFGHLVMECKGRPELVGGNISNWNYFVGKGKAAFYQYFDKFSLDKNNNLIEISSTLDTFFKGDWKRLGHYIKESKHDLFAKGYANQSDANYFAYRVLNKYHKICKNLSARFPYFIIDEAQDTNEIQMEILNLLVKEGGLTEIMLIGDPDQAIFEWIKARPELFENKYKKENWHCIPYNENRRSSQLICNAANAFLGEKKSEPYFENNAKDFPIKPSIVEYIKDDPSSINKIKEEFLSLCEQNSVVWTANDPKIAIVYRSKAFGEYFGFPAKYDDLPWITGKFYVRDIVQGKFLYEKGEYKKGYKLMEQGYLKAISQSTYISSEEIQQKIDEKGFRNHRNEIFTFINKLPLCQNRKLNNWLGQASREIPELEFQAIFSKSNILISDLFNQTRENKNEFPYHLGTIHSVKGSTFDAILVFLKEKAHQTLYKNLLNPSKPLSDHQKEELRIVYVAITRSRQLLMVAVPEGLKEPMSKKLGID